MKWLRVATVVVSCCLPQLSLAETLPVVTSLSTDFIAVTQTASYQTTVAVYGENLGYLLDDTVTVQLGPLTASSVSGNSTGMNLTFMVDSTLIADSRADYPLEILQQGVVIVTSTAVITVYNPYVLSYETNQPKRYLNAIDRPHQRTKETIGLNVHWTLGSDASVDDRYEQRLTSSHTIWAREHFSYKLVMGDDAAAWLKRYDQMMLRYQASDMRVVGMLAYGDTGDEFAAPSTSEWKHFVRLVVKRYRNDVDVWEIWNEPDSTTYLQPNNWKTYRPLLKTGSAMIREYDPDAIVLNGAIADIADHSFTKKLYDNGARYFDELNVHLYYCDEYRDDNKSLQRLQEDWESFRKMVSRQRANEPMWITELGCSTGLDGVTKKFVKQYFRVATKLLLSYNQVRPILLYTFRDRPYLEVYEAEFGLLTDDLTNKPAWRWYKLLPSQ
jgi:hypothetical protein